MARASPQGRVACGLEIQDSRVQILALPHASSLALGKRLNLRSLGFLTCKLGTADLPQDAESSEEEQT